MRLGSNARLAIAGLAASAIAASGCAIGPKYRKPSTAVPVAYKEVDKQIDTGNWKAAEPADATTREGWWMTFSDQRLNELEGRLNVTNQNIAAAVANVQVARAMVRQARAQYFPTLSANPSITPARVATGFGQSVGRTFTAYVLPFEASWEPDPWGRVRNTVASARFALQASAADLENVRLSSQAELAANYWGLRAQDALIQVTNAAAKSYQDALDLTRARYTAGLESDEAVSLAETQLYATRAEATNLEILRAQYEHAIAVLIGEPPSTFSIAIDAGSSLTSPAVPAGVPSELLERRPDIAAAERAVAQANAQIGIAQTAFFPATFLNGSFGFESLSLATWFTWPSRIWAVGPSLAQTIFDAGLRRATVQQYRAVYEQTVATYRQSVLTAFQEVEDNLAALRILAQVIDEQNATVQSAERTLALADVRYRSGIDPYLNVIVAQAALLNAQQAAVTYRGQRLAASVQLIKSLGGGWNVSQLQSVTSN
jgi:NodT family efflux transporter outer membrane factor (OMF) lipoprotein